MLFNFLTQIGTLMCILLFFFFFVPFHFLFLPVLFFFFFLKEGASVQQKGELAGPVLEQQNGMEQSCPDLQDVVPFLKGDEILPNQKYFLHWHLTSHVA